MTYDGGCEDGYTFVNGYEEDFSYSFTISESADLRINELLDEVESLGIKWSADELDDEGLALSGFDIVWYLTNKIFTAFISDFEKYVESVGGDVDFYDLNFEVKPFNGAYHVLFEYQEIDFDDEYTDGYISGDRDTVFAELLEKCREIDEIY